MVPGRLSTHSFGHVCWITTSEKSAPHSKTDGKHFYDLLGDDSAGTLLFFLIVFIVASGI